MAGNILIIVSQKNFSEAEFLYLKKFFQDSGGAVTLASHSRAPVLSVSGQSYVPDLAVGEIKADAFAALILLGDPVSFDLFEDPTLFRLIQQFKADNKLMAALGKAPAVLADAGVLISKTATAHHDFEQVLVDHGAEYTGMPVVVDGVIVTAKEFGAIKEFARAIAGVLGI